MIRDSEAPLLQGIGSPKSDDAANTYFCRVSATSEGFDAFWGQIAIETKFVQTRERGYIRAIQVQIHIYFISIVSIGSNGNPKNHRVLCSDTLPILKGLSSGGVGRGSTTPAHPWVIPAARARADIIAPDRGATAVSQASAMLSASEEIRLSFRACGYRQIYIEDTGFINRQRPLGRARTIPEMH